jgi:hypothetical protein
MPPHEYDESALEEIGDFLGPMKDGARSYRIRFHDLSLLAELPGVEFRFAEKVRLQQSQNAQRSGQFGSMQLTVDGWGDGTPPRFSLQLFRMANRDSISGSTDQTLHLVYDSTGLHSGVVADSLPPGYYVCHLIASAACDGCHLYPRSETAGFGPCADIYIFGIVVSEGSISVVHIPHFRFLYGLDFVDDVYAFIKTDSGDYIDISFKLVEGGTLSQVDSAGVNYHARDKEWYRACVPVLQAYELPGLSSIAQVRLDRAVHFSPPLYTFNPSEFCSMKLTMNPPAGAASSRYILQVFGTASPDSVIDTTNKVYERVWETSDLQRGITMNRLYTGYHQCHLVALPDSSGGDSVPGSETDGNVPCSDIYIFGIVVGKGYVTSVSVPDSLFETHAADSGRFRSKCVVHWKLRPEENFIRKQ